MSINEEFDELARRKLEACNFPYAEADWKDARSRIDAERSGRRNRWAWITGTALLIIGILVWTGTRPTRIGTSPAPHPDPTVVAQKRGTGTAAGTPGTTTAPVEHEGTGQTASTEIPVEAPTDNVENTAVAQNRMTSRSAPERSGLRGQKAPPENAPKKPGPSVKARAVQTVGPRKQALPVATAAPQTERANGNSPETQPQADVHGSDDPLNNGASTETSTAAIAMATTEKGQASVVQDTTESVLPDRISAIGPESPKDNTDHGALHAEASPEPDPVPVAAQITPVHPDTSLTAPPPSATPGDSSSLPAPASVPPIIPERAPWEISVLGGLFTSTTTYHGGESADWSNGSGSAASPGFGAEVMHTGRNISLGFGLHYGIYAERMRTEAVDRTTTTMDHFWYLAAVDTSVLVVTDTMAGTPPSYHAHNVDTTLYVLAHGTDTVVDHQHLRDARDAVNRVSYLEIPLLADAHLVQGRWNLGLRGGPTIGLLTGRRGSLPDPGGEGYVAFHDVAFREVVFGYMARAYIRYRFTAGWSIGLEPELRGQLFNNLEANGLARRSMAKGVLLSLTYRLR